MTDREFDPAMWLNELVFCYACGRFSKPVKGKPPKGWTMLYQPHGEGPPGLNVCSPACADRVREAMTKGPVTEPLEMRMPLLPAEIRAQMDDVVREEVAEAEYEATRGTQLVTVSGITRFGQMVRDARLRAGKTLADVEESLIDEGLTRGVMASVERGRRPMTWAQMEAFCHFVGVVDRGQFGPALVEYHHTTWEAREESVRVTEQTADARTVPNSRDVVELVEALRSAISSMDVAAGTIERLMAAAEPREALWGREGDMAKQAVMLLQASRRWALQVLSEGADGEE